MRDPYEVLGIQRGATDDEIKKAYRAKCKRWHPDLNPNDPTAEEHFKEVQAAYDAITKGDTGPQMADSPAAVTATASRVIIRAATSRDTIRATARTAGSREISASGSTRLVSDSVLAAISSRAGPATPALTPPRCRRPATLWPMAAMRRPAGCWTA